MDSWTAPPKIESNMYMYPVELEARFDRLAVPTYFFSIECRIWAGDFRASRRNDDTTTCAEAGGFDGSGSLLQIPPCPLLVNNTNTNPSPRLVCLAPSIHEWLRWRLGHTGH